MDAWELKPELGWLWLKASETFGGGGDHFRWRPPWSGVGGPCTISFTPWHFSYNWGKTRKTSVRLDCELHSEQLIHITPRVGLERSFNHSVLKTSSSGADSCVTFPVTPKLPVTLHSVSWPYFVLSECAHICADLTVFLFKGQSSAARKRH
jgi:hypothetical protein